MVMPPPALLLVCADPQADAVARLAGGAELVRVADLNAAAAQLAANGALTGLFQAVLVDYALLVSSAPADRDRTQRALAETPLIVLTPWALPPDPGQLSGLRVDAYLTIATATPLEWQRALIFGRQQRAERQQLLTSEARWRGMLAGAPDDVATDDVATDDVATDDVATSNLAGRVTSSDRPREPLTVEQSLFVGPFEAAVGAKLLIDSDGLIMRCNTNASAMFGYTEAELVGQPVEMLLPAGFRAAHVISRMGWIASGDVRPKSTSLTFAGQAKDGARLDLLIALRRVPTPRGTAVLCGLQDITERVAMEQRLRQSQKMEAVGQLAGGVAHDFNNLLTAITSFSTFARDDLPADSPAHADLGEVLHAARRAADLTRQLLTFSRRQPVDPQAVQINERLRQLTRMLARLLGPAIEINLDLAVRLPRVWMDPSNFEQVVVNLCVNARDAMPDGGPLHITTRSITTPCPTCAGEQPHSPVGSGCVELAITDRGHGMDEETIAHVFEPFFTTKGPDRGTGLGLATCYGIVTQAGGVISLESAPGRGTTMRVRLPATAGKSRSLSLTGSWQPAGGAELILVVDDDAAVLRAVARTLTNGGFRVLTAAGSTEALSLLREGGVQPDLLLTDLVMPGMSGLQLIAQAEATVARVVVMTGHIERKPGVEDALKSHVLLQKPFKPDELLRSVRAALDAPDPAPIGGEQEGGTRS